MLGDWEKKGDGAEEEESNSHQDVLIICHIIIIYSW